SGTALAYLEDASTLRVQKGSNANNVTVYITVVEFTGSNWTVLHGDSGSVSSDTGTITIRDGSDGTGTATDVSAWSEAIIFSQHRGDNNANGVDDAIADNWPLMDIGSNDQTVDWTFHSDHASAQSTNRQFVHVLNNTNLNVTRFQDTSNSSGESTVNITSAGLTDVNQALIVGSSTSSGTGTAYGRGWRNYYINSTTQAAHWTHRSGNTMAHEIQIVDLSALTTTVSGPEINLQGLATTISDGDITPSVADNTDFGPLVIGSTLDHTFTIQNTGTLTLNLTGGAPLVDISGDVAYTIVTQPSASSIASGGGNLTFVVRFSPTISGTVQAVISIDNDDSNENPYNFTIEGNGVTSIAEGPGGVTTDLELWLKSTDGLAYSDGQSISLWSDQGSGSDATVNTSGQEPTYRDNPTKNVNFNPVVEFDNSYGTYTLDSDYSYDDTSTQFLEGTSGMYTQDIFVVIIPDETPFTNNFGFMDIFCGDENPGTNETDATGIGAGYYTARFSGEILCFALGTTSSGNGYGVAEIGTGSSYDNVGIINARNNIGVTQQELYYNANNIETTQNDLPDFSNVSDSKYWIGRSEGWEASTNARIAEIITFSSRKDDASLTDERNRVQSYLAIKYGITLGVNGTSQDYVDSDGTVIWDQSVNSGYNHDIAGIGRDDDSDLSQKQSKTVNTPDDITMGLTDIATTNNANLNTFTSDKDFLIWGNDDGTLAAQTPVNLDLSSGISGLNTLVDYTRIGRVWKVVENGSVETVKISIPQSMLATTISPPGEYIMLFSNSPTFDASSENKLMSLNGSDLETTYDFNGTKYITFAYAPERTFVRSIYFDGVQDYLNAGDVTDLSGAFTISAWINKDSNDGSIVSKRDSGFTAGYDFRINVSGNLEMSWINSGAKTITSSITIPNGIWHHVAVIYDGTDAKLYIDGVEDSSITTSLITPLATSEDFRIATGNSPTSYFEGNIDEIRIWDLPLSEDELHFIMNQEIEDNSNFVSGSYFTNIGATLTKNDINTMPWANLEAYYPMSTYIYNNSKDESDNGHIAVINNLNTVDNQTAPLPYISDSNGDWDTNSSWLNGSEQTIPGATSLVDSNSTVDWNIV
ncbi:MAG: choice-of-anchor D domain-containing protein, partial [Urechidicola sp.]|nr:choice-of-anchor D domain-containing protein [Urechidicola sp.]